MSNNGGVDIADRLAREALEANRRGEPMTRAMETAIRAALDAAAQVARDACLTCSEPIAIAIEALK